MLMKKKKSGIYNITFMTLEHIFVCLAFFSEMLGFVSKTLLEMRNLSKY